MLAAFNSVGERKGCGLSEMSKVGYQTRKQTTAMIMFMGTRTTAV